jgi:hypothetical protein
VKNSDSRTKLIPGAQYNNPITQEVIQTKRFDFLEGRRFTWFGCGVIIIIRPTSGGVNGAEWQFHSPDGSVPRSKRHPGLRDIYSARWRIGVAKQRQVEVEFLRVPSMARECEHHHSYGFTCQRGQFIAASLKL